MSSTQKAESVPSFESVDAFQSALAAKAKFESLDLYPRDGTVQLCEAEAQVACLACVQPRELVLFNSGMAAVEAAIQTALDLTANKKQPVLAYCPKAYSQNKTYLSTYIARRGVRLVTFNAADPTSLETVIRNDKPDVIFSETVGNGGDLPLLDTQLALELAAQHVPNAITVLDNTLPLSTGLPLGKSLKENDRVLVVESGTKAYTFNHELMGLIYSKNSGLLKAVRSYRRTCGTMPGSGSLSKIQALLPTKPIFDARNHRLFSHTEALALHLHQALREDSDFTIAHPSLPGHPNHDFAVSKYKKGATPVLFLIGKGDTDQYVLARRLWAHSVVREHADIGQSFGFDRARILPTEKHNTLRISGGAETDVAVLGPALAEALVIK